LALANADAATIEGRVVGVADGDTLTVIDSARTQHRIRLAGIDAPEKGQPFAVRARRNLAQMVASQDVTAFCLPRERDGRQICKVWTVPSDCRSCSRTLDVGLAQVTVGLAWHFETHEEEQSEEDRYRYAYAEREARARRAGHWLDDRPVPPWEWRNR
jgi:endonuclease YncB( thermonuclease family)